MNMEWCYIFPPFILNQDWTWYNLLKLWCNHNKLSRFGIESGEHLHKSGAHLCKSGAHLLYKSGSHQNMCASWSQVGHLSLAEAMVSSWVYASENENYSWTLLISTTTTNIYIFSIKFGRGYGQLRGLLVRKLKLQQNTPYSYYHQSYLIYIYI